MKSCILLTALLIATTFFSVAQNTWTMCNSPNFESRVDDIFMVNPQTGYAVCGDGQVVKTIDGGNNWFMILQDTTIYWRSVEFITSQKGFIGGFPSLNPSNTIFRMTTDGGTTWTDLTSLINTKARRGICGLAMADSLTVYGCGNWFQDSAYIVKSSDGGNSWTFIDMSAHATSLIDMHFTSKDTGFATGSGTAPLKAAVILYTTDGGQNWTNKFQDTSANDYGWKIQHPSSDIYFVSIDQNMPTPPKIIKSIDGGMNWVVHTLSSSNYDLLGVGFIDSLKGWAGGDYAFSFESTDGGLSWTPVNYLCPKMNRVFKVNDTLLFASGNEIWKYGSTPTSIHRVINDNIQYASVICYPNPANENLTIESSLTKSTHAVIGLFDEQGKQVKAIDNSYKSKGEFQYTLDTKDLRQGTYYIVLKTHEDKQVAKIIVTH